MLSFFRHLGPGVFLIVAISAVLLVCDGQSRRARAGGGAPRVALFQYASRSVLDVSIAGCVEGLLRRGFVDGSTMKLERYNAESDLITANNIAKVIVDEQYDIVLTASTLCLQAMAAANRDGVVVHVFGAVTDPYGAGVGISAEDHTVHPPWLVGVGSFQPIRDVFQLARQCRPSLRTIGTVMCPTETCSTACLALAQSIAAELGITIEVAQVFNANDVQEATAGLLARDVEAIFIGGDNLVENVSHAVISTALKAGVPVIGYASEHAAKGALLGVGVDYFEMGVAQGELAAGILLGEIDPADFAVDNFNRCAYNVNLDTLRLIRPGWSVPEDVRAGAVTVIENGVAHTRAEP